MGGMLVSHCSGDWQSEIRVPTWSDSGASPLPDFLLTVLTWQGGRKRKKGEREREC